MGRWLQKESCFTLGWTTIPSMLNIQNRMFSFLAARFFGAKPCHDWEGG